MHLSNHALGLISVRVQEAVRPWVMALWHSPPGQVLLYGSLSTHAAIALIILFRRRHYYMPAWEAIQILLGLMIPYLLLVHIVNTRGTRILTGIDIDYTYQDCQSLGRSMDTSSTNCARIVGLGTFCRRFAFLVAASRLVSARFSSHSCRASAGAHGRAAGIRRSWNDNDSARRSDPQWMREIKARGVPADPIGQVSCHTEGLGRTIVVRCRRACFRHRPDSQLARTSRPFQSQLPGRWCD